ncbi:MAG TPA: hypothetical protein VI318_06855 [Baekduia sp.]
MGRAVVNTPEYDQRWRRTHVNILFVTHLPAGSRGGDADRVNGLMAGLRAGGHVVELRRLPIRKPIHARRWRPWWYVEPDARWLSETATLADASDLVVASLLPGATAVARALVERRVSAPFVYDAHNDEARLAAQTMRAASGRRVGQMEDVVFATADTVWVAGERDAEELGRRYPKASLANIPNGVDRDLPDLTDVAPVPGAAFTYGTWSYRPNADGLARLAATSFGGSGEMRVFGTIGEAQSRTLTKSAQTAHANLRWTFRGFEKDWHALAGSGATGVIPVWSGAGTKLRAVQLAAMGAPTIPTSEALSGLPEGFHELMPPVDDPAKLLARALEGAAASAEARRELRRWVLDELSWDRLAEVAVAAALH